MIDTLPVQTAVFRRISGNDGSAAGAVCQAGLLALGVSKIHLGKAIGVDPGSPAVILGPVFGTSDRPDRSTGTQVVLCDLRHYGPDPVVSKRLHALTQAAILDEDEPLDVSGWFDYDLTCDLLDSGQEIVGTITEHRERSRYRFELDSV